ncbi:MAG TPA: universal stress protein [Acidimicrobiales bacterium]|jgi:nucleotide-binding universal stress UspA family protein|nr:universal stress protein [Acidimicrobiales bacterium]
MLAWRPTGAARSAALIGVPVYEPASAAEGVRLFLDEHPAFLLVVGSHARTGMERLVFGSTASVIVRQSYSPVLVVRREHA